MKSQTEHLAATEWKIDPAHTLVEFTAKHMMITNVRGRLRGVEGILHLDPEDPGKGHVEVTIDASSLDTGVTDRDNHLRSADFLDVEHHPEITFRSTEVKGEFRKAGDEFTVTGDLEIRGTSRPVTLTAVFEGEGKDPWGGTRVSFSADTRIDRRDFDLTWNKALESGGVLVSNEIRIHLEVQAVATQ